MVSVRATVDPSLYDAVADLAGRYGGPRLATELGELVAACPEFGAEGRAIAADPAGSFALERFGDEDFWAGQRALRDGLAARLDECAATVGPYLPPTRDERVATVTVLPVPGLTTCYGADDGRQIFGLYDGADLDEAVLFCAHTYLHEVSGLVNTETSRRAERDPSTARALRHLVMLLIRNEGIANLAMLDQVRALRDAGSPMLYFDYAPLIDDRGARERSLTAARQLLAKVTDGNAAALLPKLTAAFKNPRLPVINLVGIHLAEAVSAAFGLRRVIDVDGREPQEFFQAYAKTPDPLRHHLFGQAMAEATIFGVTVAAARPVDLSLGDPGFGPPPAVLDAVDRALRRGPVGYAPRGGLASLRTALARKLAERNGIDADPADVVVTTGASHGLYAALADICAPGDRVLLPAPCFPLYRLAADTLRLTMVDYAVHEVTGEPDWERLEAAAPDAAVLLWNYPSNPLGTVADPGWTDRLAGLLDAHPRLVLASDEVYEDLCYGGDHVTPAAQLPAHLRGRVLSFYSFSKSHGLTGWRVGYVHAPGRAPGLARRHWAMSMSTPTPGQVAALAALAAGRELIAERVATLHGNRDLAVAALHEMGLPCQTPAAGLYCWFGVGDADAFVRRAATESRVLLASGAEFGPWSADRVRLSFATDRATLQEGLRRLAGMSARGG